MAFLIHGGPQGSFGNAWSWRWNPQAFAGAGYGVVMVDFHGSTGYGQAFTDSISGDWGGKPLEDLKLGLEEALKANPWLDGLVLRSETAVTALLDGLDDEKDAEVLVSLAINALAAAGEMRLSWRVQGRMWDEVWPVLKRANLPDPAENAALHDLGRSFRWRTDVDAHQALEGLRRFWAE